MSKSEEKRVLDKAYDLALLKNEERYGGCGQCVIAVLQDAFRMPSNEVFKAMSGYAGVGATEGDGSCGAYVAGILFLSGLRGRERDNFADPDRIRFVSFATARKLHRKSIDEFGSIICREIQMKIMGRPYYLPDPDEMAKFLDAGGTRPSALSYVARQRSGLPRLRLRKGSSQQRSLPRFQSRRAPVPTVASGLSWLCRGSSFGWPE